MCSMRASAAPEAVVASALATVGQQEWPFFVHFDVDVLDQIDHAGSRFARQSGHRAG